MPPEVVTAVIRCPIHWIHRQCPGLGLPHLKRHLQLSDDDMDSRSQLNCMCEGTYEAEDNFNPEKGAVRCSGLTKGSHIGDGSQHGAEATSRDRWGDFRLLGGMRALNDAPGTESQSAHEFSVSIVATRNGPTGEQEEQNKDI
uniref:Protein Wnt n=1 Tax=Mesocestoides corti TaxID=53468 RepID=A0A5K3F0Z0_MESCO